MRRFILSLIVASGLGLPSAAIAQTAPTTPEIICGVPESASNSAAPLVDIDDGPIVRALLVFVRFRDDDQAGVGGWPLYADSTQLPPDALNLLAPTLADIPNSPSTLSRYYYDQSRTADGVSHLQVYGDVFPLNAAGQPVTYVTQHENSWYYSTTSNGSRGYSTLTKEILDYLHADPRFDIANYDQDGIGQNGDGVLDHLFLVIRTDKSKKGPGQEAGSIYYSGCSSLNGCETPIIGPSLDLSYSSPSRSATVRVDLFESGSHNYMWDPSNVVHLPYLVTLLAHEWGHELWNEEAGFSVHRLPIRENRVPSNAVAPSGPNYNCTPNPPYLPGRNEYGYNLMAGGCAGKIGGSLTVAARERDLLGWLSPTVLGTAQSGQTFTLGDLYTTGQAFKLSVANTPDRLVYLSNHQPVGWFDVRRTEPTETPPYNQVEAGLFTRGMLATYSTSLGTLDVLPPDNTLNKETICPGGVFTNDMCVALPNPYETDAYGPTTGRQLTPWTSPNINGCANYSTDPHCSGAGFTSSWQAIDNIRYAPDGLTMQFEFYQDFRTQPLIAIRSASRMGAETINSTFNGTFTDVRVTNGASLVIGDGITLSFTGNLVVEAGATLTLDPGTTLRFAQGKRLLVYGTLIGTGADLTSIDNTGWHGVYVGPNPLVKAETSASPSFATGPPAAVLTGVDISNVLNLNVLSDDPYPPNGALEVRNRRVLITGNSTTGPSTILGSNGANGILAFGSSAQVTVQGGSQIESNSGAGVYATAGAQILLTDGTFVRQNSVGGVHLIGYGTRADITGGAQVNSNMNAGVTAFSQAYARIRANGTGTATSVSTNHGGPTALSSGSIDGGQCTADGIGIRPNRFADNQLGGFYDARAEDGSTVAAQRAYWGGRTALTLVFDKSSTVDVFPVAPTATFPDPACPSVGTTSGRGIAQNTRNVAMAGTDEPSAARGGPTTAAVVALATEARQAAWAGDPDGAFALLAQAASASVTEDDREAVYGAIGALVAEADSALTVPALVASLETTAAASGANQLWARRALSVAYAVTARPADADAVAAGLTVAQAGTDHATFAHGLRVRLGVEADSLEMALDRLSALAATVVATDTFAVDTYASSLALVAASFPTADLSALTGGAAGRGTSSTSMSRAGTASGADASARQGGDAFVDDVAVFPNPAAGRGTVRLSVATPAASATATVYDALGRRVAVLHDGPLTAGPHDFAFDTAALAPGVYVVHVHISPQAGSTWTDVRRITVTR